MGRRDRDKDRDTRLPPPAAIFERSVQQQQQQQEKQQEEKKLQLQLQLQLQLTPPADCTSPVLDSAVELLATTPLADVDLVQVPHRHHSLPLALFGSDDKENEEGREGREGRDDNDTPARPPVPLPHRKSISFYSFADLCSYERDRVQGVEEALSPVDTPLDTPLDTTVETDPPLLRVCSANEYLCAQCRHLCQEKQRNCRAAIP